MCSLQARAVCHNKHSCIVHAVYCPVAASGQLSQCRALFPIGWIAAMLLLFRWWAQLQAKASNSGSAPLLEDEPGPLHSSQYSSLSLADHHSRHHPASHLCHPGEGGLIEQQGSGGSDTSRGSSSNRGVLPGLFKRRHFPAIPSLSLPGQCHLSYHACLSALQHMDDALLYSAALYALHAASFVPALPASHQLSYVVV